MVGAQTINVVESETPETDQAIEGSKSYYFKWPSSLQPMKGVKLPEDETPLEATCRRLEKERNEALAILQYFSHYLGQGLGEDSTSPKEYRERIRNGILELMNNIHK